MATTVVQTLWPDGRPAGYVSVRRYVVDCRVWNTSIGRVPMYLVRTLIRDGERLVGDDAHWENA